MQYLPASLPGLEIVHLRRGHGPTHDFQSPDCCHIPPGVVLDEESQALHPLELHVEEVHRRGRGPQVVERYGERLRGLDVLDVLEAEVDPVHVDVHCDGGQFGVRAVVEFRELDGLDLFAGRNGLLACVSVLMHAVHYALPVISSRLPFPHLDKLLELEVHD